MTEKIIAFVLLALCFLIFMRTCWIWNINRARRRGLFNPHKRPTLFDVKILLEKGEKDAAVKVYGRIYGVNSRDAKKAVDGLERSLHF